VAERALPAAELEKLLTDYAAQGVERLAIDLPNPSLKVLMRQMELLADIAKRVGAL